MTSTMKTTKSYFELHDLLLLIGAEERTGELVIESGNNIGSLLFHEGKIILAFSPYTRAIGDRLVEQGVLTESELLDILQQQRSGPPVPIGMILQKAGKVTFAVLEKMVQEQIRSSIRDFALWKPVDFIFTKKVIQPVDGIYLSVHEFLPPEVLASARKFAGEIPAAARK